MYTYEDKLEPTWLCGKSYQLHCARIAYLQVLIKTMVMKQGFWEALIVTVVMKPGLSALIALQRYVVLLFYHLCKQFMQVLLQNHFHYRKQVLQINFKIVNLRKYMLNRDLIS